MDVADWLRGLGLGQCAALFRENDVDADLIPSLTAEDLKELGIASVGHRRRLMDAIAALRTNAVPTTTSTPIPAPSCFRSQRASVIPGLIIVRSARRKRRSLR